jgi:uncharacterized membrane protein
MEILFLPLALLGGFVVLLVIGLIVRLQHGKPSKHDAEHEQLRARYASGAIGREEYEQQRRQLRKRRTA